MDRPSSLITGVDNLVSVAASVHSQLLANAGPPIDPADAATLKAAIAKHKAALGDLKLSADACFVIPDVVR